MNKNEKNKNQLKGRVEEIEAKVKKAEGRTEGFIPRGRSYESGDVEFIHKH